MKIELQTHNNDNGVVEMATVKHILEHLKF
jgi:hypothetical protein